MLFSSLEFLYLFLPLTLLLYFCSPRPWRNAVLLFVSLVFYAFGEPIYLFLMLFTIAADYLFGRGIAYAQRNGRSARWILVVSVVLNLALLGFFKYYDFLARSFSLPTLGLALPIGISFYTFQALSYVIDVYRNEVEAQRNLVSFGTYVTLFPQLIAGPIVRYQEIDEQLTADRRYPVSRLAEGIATFSAGLAKKVLLANAAGELAEGLLLGKVTLLGSWLWLIFYAFQIYFDFSGYSDMAIGLGRIFGFDFPENFRYPYCSRSITEFWRRWHITLSTWFREYVYIPLGGNRKGRWRTYRNLLITWALTGLWHGASWNFLFWGLYFFCLLALEKALLGKYLARLPRGISHLYALFFILLGWLIFSADGLAFSQILLRVSALFGVGCEGLLGEAAWDFARKLPLLLAMAIGATPLPKRAYFSIVKKYPRGGRCLRNALCVLSLLLCTAYLVDSGYNPFLYFRF